MKQIVLYIITFKLFFVPSCSLASSQCVQFINDISGFLRYVFVSFSGNGHLDAYDIPNTREIDTSPVRFSGMAVRSFPKQRQMLRFVTLANPFSPLGGGRSGG